MRIIKGSQVTPFLELLQKRASVSIKEDDVQRTVKKIILDVQKQGDRAVKKYTEKFDSLKLKSLAISKREIESAAKKADADFMKVLKTSAKRIRKFHRFGI